MHVPCPHGIYCAIGDWEDKIPVPKKRGKLVSASGMVQRKGSADLRTRDRREAISHLLTLYQGEQGKQVGD